MDYELPIPSAERLENEKLIMDTMFASDQRKAYNLEQNEKIVTSVAEFQHARNPYHTPLHCWSLGKHNKLLGMGPWHAKPDLILIPLHNGYRILDEYIFWPDIFAVGEATVSSGWTNRMEETVNIKGFLMMFCQVILSMYKDTRYIHILDRQGKVTLGPFKYFDDTDKFLAVIICLSFGSTTTIGLNSTMTRTKGDNKFMDENKLRFGPKYKNVPKPTDPTKTNLVAEVIYSYVGQNELAKWLGEKLDPEAIMKNKQCNIQEIMCIGCRYKVLGELFHSQGIVGHGTHVWCVEADDEHGYLKWIRLTTKTKTIPPYLPKVKAYEIGQMTSNIRGQDLFSPNLLLGENAAKEQSQSGNEARQCRRIVSLPVSLALGQVKDMVELLGVFLDITKAIKFLRDENCMHWDISFSNILLREKPMQLDEFDWFCSPKGE
ncbi:hypothetical protein DXG01_003798 [Tephrocybe rancida]|nr:hypothetical protein DXG01_003798 [Tephrocybe rancida]